MRDAVWRRIDWGLFGGALLLVGLGAVAMSSATVTLNPVLAGRHLTWIALGVLVALLVSSVSYRRWMDLAFPLYGVAVLLLVLVQVMGATRLGATRSMSCCPTRPPRRPAPWTCKRLS